jgi:hypothetical protein
MVDENQERPPQSGDRATGVDEDVANTGDEGRRAAGASPPIADDAVPGQTQTPAPADDVGVPPDEEMGRPDE